MYVKKPFEQDEAQDNPSNRRRAKRRHLIYYLRVWDRDVEAVLGHVVDITPEGLMLISDQPIESGKKFNLEIRWNEPEGESRKIQFEAESRWSKQDVNADFYDTGLMITQGASEAFVPIQDMIDQIGFND
jgi:hypothetical protein